MNSLAGLATFLACILTIEARADDPVVVDLTGFRAEHGIAARVDGDRLTLDWPMDRGEMGRIVIDSRAGSPLIESLGIRSGQAIAASPILRGIDPAIFLTVGTRVGESGRPPGMSAFNAFFDSPAKRPHETFQATLALKKVRVFQAGRVATIALGDLKAGPFSGELRIIVYQGSRLLRVEAVVKTDRNDCAFLYDSGLVAANPGWKSLAWTDPEGKFHREAIASPGLDRSVAARHRTVVAESASGSIACFPEPHRFFFARDLTDNLKNVWLGSGHLGLEDRAGFGIGQPGSGGGAYAPWYNAPPGTEQHLGIFYLLTSGKADDAISETLRYTRGDRYADLPGHVTFTSHWHMATAVAAMREIERGGPRSTPDFVKMFQDMNVNIIHLAEFHGDGHPQDPGPLRIPEMKAMFDECKRLSIEKMLFLPGEEANAALGPPSHKVRAGHWLYLFPKPVYWTMKRAANQAFSEEKPGIGTIYHVGDGDDMDRLLQLEHGLAWTAHPRIKGSAWTPDAFRKEAFFHDDHWLGAAWKGMPVDLSRDRLGERGLDLLDDMSNWGDRKQLLGEVDVFKIDQTHELYGHMNINYLKLDRIPRFDEGWKPVLDALRAGAFFVTTGEVLIRDFQVIDRSRVQVELDWTFPMQSLQVVSGDGKAVYRERIDLADSSSFGRQSWTLLRPDLTGRVWVRVEAWDVAGDGAFSQPVWLDSR